MKVLNHKIFCKDTNREWVVFLHGIGSGASMWFKQLREFRKYFNIILLDLPGHGDAEYGLKDMQNKSFKDIAIEVLKVLELNKIEKAHFVGISLGTIVIQVINKIAPDKVMSMVLGGAVESMNLFAKAIMRLTYYAKYCLPYMTLYKACAWVLMPKKHHKEARTFFIKGAVKLGQKEFICWYNLTKEIGKVFNLFRRETNKKPKLYIMGSEDYMFLPYIENKVDLSQNESLEIIPNCGHVCNIEKASEFNSISIAFLKNSICQRNKT